MNPQKDPKTKLCPELAALKAEIRADTNKLIGLLKAGLELLLEVKGAREEGLRECQLVKEKNTELQARVERVKNENRKLSNKVNELEDKLLEGNIIFQGILEQLWEPSNTTKEKVLNAISHTISGDTVEDRMDQACKIPIKDVTRLGRYVAMRTRPVLVEFCHKGDVEYLLSNRTHLPKGVYVDKQYSAETERERRKLWPILKAAWQHENYKGKCRMDGPKLVIKGRNYSSKNLYQLPEEINGFRATSKSEGNVIGFFGELNPFSNFHHAPFVINGQKYHSSEQYIQHQKCVLFGDCSTEQLFLAAETPIDCKQLAKNISNFNAATWKENAKASCTPGILTKFEQHDAFGNLLRSTGTKTLIECCNDKDWGTGVPLHYANALKSEHWHSQ